MFEKSESTKQFHPTCFAVRLPMVSNSAISDHTYIINFSGNLTFLWLKYSSTPQRFGLRLGCLVHLRGVFCHMTDDHPKLVLKIHSITILGAWKNYLLERSSSRLKPKIQQNNLFFFKKKRGVSPRSTTMFFGHENLKQCFLQSSSPIIPWEFWWSKFCHLVWWETVWNHNLSV